MNRLTLLALVFLVGCDGCKKKVVTDPTDGNDAVVAPVDPNAGKKETPAPVAEMMKNFGRVFFEFDAATLSSGGKEALEANAAIMSQYPDIKLEIQGHADERGTTDYNLALGQKRADAMVQYLLARGISSSRVKSVSYGEERPLDGRATERAWSENRRAEFIVTWSGDAPVKGSAN
jgi:peptidoglycan-associated lipoprotein